MYFILWCVNIWVFGGIILININLIHFGLCPLSSWGTNILFYFRLTRFDEQQPHGHKGNHAQRMGEVNPK